MLQEEPMSDELRKRGRRPTFMLQSRVKHDIHLYMVSEVWQALYDYCQAIGELSVSVAVRRLVREKLTELGYLKPGVHPPSSSTKDP